MARYANAPTRKDILLRAAYDLLKLEEKSKLPLTLLDRKIRYGGKDAEGFVLLNDIALELDIDG